MFDVASYHHLSTAPLVAPAIVLSSADLKDKTSSAWDATSLDGESLSSQTSPAMKIRSKDNKNNQMIKNTMPAIITRPKSG